MRKILVLFLTLFIALSLVACGANDNEEREPVAPSEEYTEPLETPEEISEEPTKEEPEFNEEDYKEVCGEWFEKIGNFTDYEAKEESENVDDDTPINLFQIGEKEYNVLEITLEGLKEEGIKIGHTGTIYHDVNGWFYNGRMYGVRNPENEFDRPINPIYLDLDESETEIEAICCEDENADITFYNGLKVGMTEEEAVKLLTGAKVSPKNFDRYYFLKKSTVTLIVSIESSMDSDIVDKIFIIKNESMQHWNYN